MSLYFQDPADRVDYGFDYTPWLDGDTISTSSWSVYPAGITVSNPTSSDTKTTVWLTGGTDGGVHRLTNHIVTTAGREKDQGFTVIVKEA